MMDDKLTTDLTLLQVNGLENALTLKDLTEHLGTFPDATIELILDGLLTYLPDFYIRKHMTYEIALDFVASEGDALVKDLDLSTPQIADVISIYYKNRDYSDENPNTLPYILCMEYPTESRNFYDELQYWASKGRI